MADNLRQAVESDGDKLADLHLWRLGPGHLGAIISLTTKAPHGPDYYRAKLARFRSLSHLTIEVHSSRDAQRAGWPAEAERESLIRQWSKTAWRWCGGRSFLNTSPLHG